MKLDENTLAEALSTLSSVKSASKGDVAALKVLSGKNWFTLISYFVYWIVFAVVVWRFRFDFDGVGWVVVLFVAAWLSSQTWDWNLGG